DPRARQRGSHLRPPVGAALRGGPRPAPIRQRFGRQAAPLMAWYVFALVDAMPSGRPGRGLSGPLAVRPMAGALLVVERRADVPPTEFGVLSAHHAVVADVAARVPAILPVRFGTLMEQADLEEALNERDDEIAEAFALVRNRTQFTWRRG